MGLQCTANTARGGLQVHWTTLHPLQCRCVDPQGPSAHVKWRLLAAQHALHSDSHAHGAPSCAQRHAPRPHPHTALHQGKPAPTWDRSAQCRCSGQHSCSTWPCTVSHRHTAHSRQQAADTLRPAPVTCTCHMHSMQQCAAQRRHSGSKIAPRGIQGPETGAADASTDSSTAHSSPIHSMVDVR